MWLYNILIALYAMLVRVVALWNPKARLWSSGRRDIRTTVSSSISRGDRVVWIHAASLGEFEQGRPVIEAIRERYPYYKILLTFYSPSGYEVRKRYPVADCVAYLPVDTRRRVRQFLDMVQPEVAIFVKYEFWLNMLAELKRRGVRTFLVSAMFRRSSIFFKSYGILWNRALDSFETIFVQDENSQMLLAELGFDNVIVAGDTRFDRVAVIAESAQRDAVVERFKGDTPLFVAGSTWAADESILLPLIEANPDVKFVIAPHEMNEQRIEHIMREVSLGAVRWSRASEECVEDKQVLILDTIGILSSVYGSADWAYIGGGFGVGIHNILEATTYGMPVAFGPNYNKFKEAVDLTSIGAAISVSNAEQLKGWFSEVGDRDEHYERCSLLAKNYTARQRGATDKIMTTIFG